MRKSYSMGQCILNNNGLSLEGGGWFQGAMSYKAGDKVGRGLRMEDEECVGGCSDVE